VTGQSEEENKTANSSNAIANTAAAGAVGGGLNAAEG
jgi:hypothetical protein